MTFSNCFFWEELIKKIYLLNLMNTNSYSTCCEDHYYQFNKTIPNLVNAVKDIEDSFNEQIDIVDGKVKFKNNQEERIIKKIEKKLSSLNLFYFLEFIFEFYKTNHKYEMNFPYKYAINLLIKNISKSKHKKIDKNRIVSILRMMNSFISLYDLTAENLHESVNITEFNIVQILKKQILHSNFYPIYNLQTNTLIEYLENILKPSVDKNNFFKEFSFSIQDLIEFVRLLDIQKNNVIFFEENNVTEKELKILESFAIDAKSVNSNYAGLGNLNKIENIFAMNPVLKYKNKFYIIGFQYFKLNFYNSLVEKIRTSFDKAINDKIGKKIDCFVKKIFKKIQSKNKYELFSGNYTPPKNENPESDLALKLDDTIIFIENKNKYLTKHSFAGDGSHILKDFILSFAFSQKQLLKHERNLVTQKELKFKNGQVLKYENQNIIKFSVSTNNWYSVMNNIPQNLLLSLIRLRFDIDTNLKYNGLDSFKKANKYLDDLNAIISELSENRKFNMKIVLHQTLFIPLELIVEKYQDDNFIETLKKLVSIKMNTDNILNIYDYYRYLEAHNKS